MSLRVEQLSLGPIGTNCYVVRRELGASEAVVVDPSGAYRGMLSVIDLVTGIGSDEKARADMLEEFIFGRIGPP